MKFTKNVFRQYLRGAIMPYVLALSLLLYIIIMLIMHTNKEDLKALMIFRNHRQALLDLDSGISIQLAGFHAKGNDNWDSLLIGERVINIRSYHWGAYKVIISKVSGPYKSWERSYLCSSYTNEGKNLILSDKANILKVNEFSQLEGNLYIPKALLKKQGIIHNTWPNAQLYPTCDSLGVFLDSLLIHTLLWGSFSEKNDMKSYINIHGNILQRSFSHLPLILANPDPIDLFGLQLSGAIMIISDRNVRIGMGCYFEHAIIVAPKVVIETKDPGTLQVLATDTIILGKNVKLGFPSFLGIFQPRGLETTSILHIGDSSIVRGCVALIANSRSRMAISRDAYIIGSTFCNTNMILHGNCLGHTHCEQFMQLTGEGVISNYLETGKIGCCNPDSLAIPILSAYSGPLSICSRLE